MIREIWSLLDGRQRRALLGMLMLGLLAAFATVGGVAAVMPFLAFLADPEQVGRHAALLSLQNLLGIGRSQDMLLVLGGAFFGAVLLSNCISLLEIVVAEKYSQSLAGALQMCLFDSYLRPEHGLLARPDGALLASNILHEVHRLANGVIYSGLMLVSQAVASVLIVGFMVLVNPVVALSAVLALGSAYLFIYLVVRRRLASYGEQLSRNWHGRARLVNEALGALKEILLMRNQSFFTGQFASFSRRVESAQAGIAAISRSPRYILECVTAASLVGAALWSSHTPGSDNWLVQLSLLGIAAYRLLPALQQSFLHAAKIRANRAAFDRIGHDLRRAQHRARLPAAPVDPAWRDRPRRGIALRDVTLRYAADRQAALRGLSLDIEAGSFVALVGPNGSGKSTLADVILGLLRPQEGRVEIDGALLDEANLASWQSATACVPQATFLLNASLAENVALGTPRSDIDEKRLHEALALANLHELLGELPRGVDEPLGEQGANLSGGQRQRVGIARALYRRPSLLVLDEATSALDADAERSLVDVLAGLRGKCTIVLIAHRVTSLRRCDRVFDLDRGVLVRTTAIEAEGGPRRVMAVP
jgi:ATP-binding cassette, subfamily B, bacterial PglK